MDSLDSENKQRVPGVRERVTRVTLAGFMLLGACTRSLEDLPDQAIAGDIGESVGFVIDPTSEDFPINGGIVGESSEYIVGDESGDKEGLWHAIVAEGGTILGAIDSIVELKGNIGYAVTVISPDKSRVIQFAGSPGGGKNALEVTAALSEDGAFASEPMLADVDMRTITPGTEVVVGSTKEVNKNFENLLDGGALSDINEYWRVEWRSAKDPSGKMLQWYTVTRYSREAGDSNWIHTPYIQFNRDAAILGEWKPVKE